MGVSNFVNAFLDLVFVPRCVSCLNTVPSGKTALCEECQHIYSLESKLLCSDCSMPYSRCRCKIHYENKVFELYRVTGYNILSGSVSRNVVLYLKHNKSRAAFNFVAEQMLDTIKTRAPYLFDVTRRTVITYVPRSKRSKRKEGYDQSYEIAKIISEKSGKPLVRAFYNRSKAPQKTLNKEERMSNAELSYNTLPEAAECSGKSVIIIDDIVTTGASIGVCGTQLMNLGAVQVIGLVYAKTEDKRDK